jgi:hypothetical protein
MKSYTWVQSNLDFLKAGSAMKNLGYTWIQNLEVGQIILHADIVNSFIGNS